MPRIKRVWPLELSLMAVCLRDVLEDSDLVVSGIFAQPRQGLSMFSWQALGAYLVFLPQKFCRNVAGIPRKNFVIFMGLPTFCLDS